MPDANTLRAISLESDIKLLPNFNIKDIIKDLTVNRQQPELGTVAQTLPQSSLFSVKLFLHGFYAGHRYDEVLNGGTGKFYFASITTEGKKMFFRGSKDGGGPAAGVWDKVNAGPRTP